MSAEGAYPDPSSEQVNPGAGPFYTQKTDSNIFSQLQRQLDTSARQREQNAAEQERSYDEQESRQQNHLDASPSSHPDPHYAAADRSPGNHLSGGGSIAEDALRAAAQAQHENQNLAQHMLSLDGPDGQDQDQDQLQPRAKRAKVSRACDECRRKKIRCDALESDPAPTCSNCKRTGAQCRFSRTPMKRGPSKGYIKELADKINTLESRLGPPSYPGAPQQGEPGYTGHYGQVYEEGQEDVEPLRHGFAAPDAPMSRKRTYSMSEANGDGVNGGRHFWNHAYSPGRQNASPWEQRQPPPGGSAQQDPPNSIQHSNAAESFSPRSSVWRPSQVDDHRRESAVAHDAENENDTVKLPGWDDGVVDEYYRIIHPTLPLLPHSKSRLRARLKHCSAMTRDAFLLALDCCMRSSPHSKLSIGTDMTRRRREAGELLASCQYAGNDTGTHSSNLVYLQTLILMALESDNHGPAVMKGQLGPPRTEWLGRASGMASYLKLNRMPDTRGEDAADTDSDARIGRRLWWILFILDRWHACSTGCLVQLPDNGSHLGDEDQIILGDTIYHLARLSMIIGHLNMMLQSPPELLSPNHSASPVISTLILGELSRFRESVEPLLTYNPTLIHISYLHVRLLIQRLTSSSRLYDLQELMKPAARMVNMLLREEVSITPLSHHFLALSTLTFNELAEMEGCRKQAREGLYNIHVVVGEHEGFWRQDSEGWDSAVRLAVKKGLLHITELEENQKARAKAKTDGVGAGADDGSGLQHLADAAVSGQDGSQKSAPAAGFDATVLLRQGYLAALV